MSCKYVAKLGKQPRCVNCGAAVGKGTCEEPTYLDETEPEQIDPDYDQGHLDLHTPE